MRDAVRVARATSRAQQVVALGEGRKNRGGLHGDKRKSADKKACRKGQW